jgi:hypothetical protein
VSRDVLGLGRRMAIDHALLAGLFAVTGTPGRRKSDPGTGTSVDEIVGPNTESVLLTRTAPPGPRWIEVSRWEDLVKASRFMGRPILRLDDGTRSRDQPLFYVPDGPQSYVFDFQRDGVNISTSGAYAPAPTPEAPVSPEPVPPSTLQPLEQTATPPAEELLLPEPPSPPDIATRPTPEVPSVPADKVVEQYLGPEVREPEETTGFPGKNKVEREIREMIHDVLVGLQKLPPGSGRVEQGTYHVQRALELLRMGRYGSAQIEVNRAARLVQDSERT